MQQATSLDRYRGSETILLVDDESVVLTLARSILRRCGYEVRDFNDPLSALERGIREEHIDLVLTDVVMPKLNGPELVKQIKRERPNIACVYMSGYDLHQITARGVEPQCEYLRKPFTPEALAKKIRSTLDGYENAN